MAIGPRRWRRMVGSAPAEHGPESAVANVQLGAAAPDASPAADAAPGTARIEPGCEMNGTLALARPLVIEGEFGGAIASESSVLVTEGGSVVATIRARTVVIRGAVVGDVFASREVVIHTGARLHGDVETPSLVVESGAFFNGRTRMYRPEQEARAGAAAVGAAL